MNGQINEKQSLKGKVGNGNYVQIPSTVKAIGLGSVALGRRNVAGCKGFYFKAIDTTNKKIYLSKEQTTPIIGVYDYLEDNTFETPAYEVGDKFNIINSMHYAHCGTIVSVKNNVITYQSELPFDEIKEDESTNAYSFYVPARPTVGTVVIHENAFVLGRDNIGAGTDGFVGGWDNKVIDSYGSTFGAHNEAGYCATAFGTYLKALGYCAGAFGDWCQSLGRCAFTFGVGCVAKAYASFSAGWETVASSMYQFVFGKHNLEDKENKYIHIVGNGESSAKRSNAHTLDWEGNAWYQGDVETGKGARLNEVKEELDIAKSDINKTFKKATVLGKKADFTGGSLDKCIFDAYVRMDYASLICFGTSDSKARFQIALVGASQMFRILLVDDSGQAVDVKSFTSEQLGFDVLNNTVRMEAYFEISETHAMMNLTLTHPNGLTKTMFVGGYTDTQNITKRLHTSSGVVITPANNKNGENGLLITSDGNGNVKYSDKSFVLKSASGKLFEISVNDYGTLKIEEVQSDNPRA